MRTLQRFLIALAVLAAPSVAAAGPPPVRVHLDDDGPGVSQAKEAQRLLETFRKELQRRKVVFVESPDEAEVRLVVREAEVFQQPKVGRTKTTRGGFRTPTGTQKDVLDTEEEIGVEVDGGGVEPVLVVRLLSGDTFVDFTNEPSDRTVTAAAKDVADDVERWLKRRPRP